MHDRPPTFMDRSQDGLRQLLRDLETLFEGDRNFGVCAPALIAGGTTVRLSSLILPDAQPSPARPVEMTAASSRAENPAQGRTADPVRDHAADPLAGSADVAAMLKQVLVNQASILDRLDRLERLAGSDLLSAGSAD